MTAITSHTRSSAGSNLYTILRAAIAFAISFGLLAFIRHSRSEFQSLPFTDIFAVIVGYVFFTLGVFTMLLSFSPQWAGRRLEQDPAAPPASRKEVGFIRLQSVVLLLAGALLIAPPLLMLYTLSPAQTRIAFAVIVIAFLIQTVLNLRLWHKADEFLRKTLSRISVVCFWTLQGLLFLAAAGERLQLIHGLTLWDACVCMLFFYLTASSILGIRAVRS